MLADLAILAVARPASSDDRSSGRPTTSPGHVCVSRPLMPSGGWSDDLPVRRLPAPTSSAPGADEYKRVFNASLLTAGLVGVGCYLAKFPLSRGFFFLAFVVGIPALLLGRWSCRRALHRARTPAPPPVASSSPAPPPHIDEIAGVLRRESWLGYQRRRRAHPARATTARRPRPASPSSATPTTSPPGREGRRRRDLLRRRRASAPARQMRGSVWDLEQHDVQVVVAPSVTDVSSERVGSARSAGCR